MRHFTLEDRIRLWWMLVWWVRRKRIVEVLGCSERTLRRELQRGTIDWVYYAKKAQEYVDRWRKKNGIARVKLLQNNGYKEMLTESLEPWISSPDSIAGRMKIEGKEFVCSKTIYNYIRLYDWGLKGLLTYKKRYKKKHIRQWKRPEWYRHISERPEEANKRSEVWHMEIDLVMSKGNRAGTMTLVDRKSRFWLIMRVESKQMQDINKVVCKMIRKEWIKKELKTITSDNGHEFFWLKQIEKRLWFEQYYADPYSSRQRWTNEQYNWQIRKFFPKWTDFSKIAVKKIQNIQTKLNRKPRKILWYRTPEEVFYNR